MAFEKMGAFTFNHAKQPDELNVAADVAKANFDSRANELKTALNKVVDLLNATTDGASGADNVGATAIDGLTGKTVQTILEELKTLVDTKETPTGAQTKANTAESSAKTYADGQVGDLAGEGRTTETVKGNADAHIAHLADLATDADGAHGLKIETGTFTPVLKGLTVAGNHTYAWVSGDYYRIGNLVFFRFGFQISSKDTNMSGELRVGGLPFVLNGAGGNYAGSMLSYYFGFTLPSGHTQLLPLGMGNTDSFQLVTHGSAVSSAVLSADAVGSSCGIRMSGVYRVA